MIEGDGWVRGRERKRGKMVDDFSEEF